MMVVGKPHLMKKCNSDIIYSMIRERGPISKPALATATKLSLPTVNRLVDELVEQGMVRENGSQGTGTVGRRARMYVSNDDAGCVISFFHTGQGWLGGVCNLAGQFRKTQHFAITDRSRSGMLSQLQDAYSQLSGNCGDQVLGVGMGIPGVVHGGAVSSIPQIPCWEGVQLQQELQECFGVPVFIENDVKLLTAGYYARECPKSCEDLLFLVVGHGLGSGMIINRKLYKGAGCFAGECGYMILDGQRSGTGTPALEQHLAELARQVEAGDSAAQAAYLRIIAQILANFITVIDPQRIALQGVGIREETVAEIRRELEQYLPCALPPIIPVDDRELGLYGAYRLCVSNTTTHMRVVEQRGI